MYEGTNSRLGHYPGNLLRAHHLITSPVIKTASINWSEFGKNGFFVCSNLNDRKSLFRFSHRELKIAPGDAVPARVREHLAAIKESELAPYPVFWQTVSDKGLLCQLGG